MKLDLSTTIAGIKFKNPVLTASGTFGYGDEITDLADVSKLGGIITKTITLKPKEGNPPPRLCEVAGGMLNSIGLQNIGVERFVKEKACVLSKLKTSVIVSIAGKTADEYSKVIGLLKDEKWIKAIELNLSCPNLDKGIVCKDRELVKEIMLRAKETSVFPLIAKLSPDVEDIAELSTFLESLGADAISLINTFPGMAIDIKTLKPKLANITGGFSGPAIKPLALRCVYFAAKTVNIPIIGCGGISFAEDAIEFFLAGASAVSIGTASFIEPKATIDIVKGIENYIKKNKLNSLDEIIGKLKV
ncbi:MAG: dihydroorotate dehydrogenase [Elusimicrobia bacterium]|nr:dihydroorotate dehydrogenase [Candidatus Liberimonas magnetica]